MTPQEKKNAIWVIMYKQAIWFGMIECGEIHYSLLLFGLLMEMEIIKSTPTPKYAPGGFMQVGETRIGENGSELLKTSDDMYRLTVPKPLPNGKITLKSMPSKAEMDKIAEDLRNNTHRHPFGNAENEDFLNSLYKNHKNETKNKS